MSSTTTTRNTRKSSSGGKIKKASSGSDGPKKFKGAAFTELLNEYKEETKKEQENFKSTQCRYIY
jgi:hypothetical protein